MASLRNELEGLLSRPEGACYLASRGDARAVLALLAAAEKNSPAPEDRAALRSAIAAFDEEQPR